MAEGYSGSPEGEDAAREAGTVAGEAACTSLGAAPVAGLCGQIGAAVFEAVYQAWNTDPSKGTMIYPEWTVRALDQARRGGLAAALDQALTGLEVVTLLPRADLVAQLEARGVEIVTTTDLDRSGRRYGDQYGNVDVPPITFELAPPSWFVPPPYPPTSATEYMAARGYDREGRTELEQWSVKLQDATFALVALLASEEARVPLGRQGGGGGGGLLPGGAFGREIEQEDSGGGTAALGIVAALGLGLVLAKRRAA